VAAAVASGTTIASAASGGRSHVQPAVVAPARDIGYAVSRPLCPTTAKPGQVTCFAMQRVPVSKGTPGSYRYLTGDTVTAGPAGGFTPADLSTLYAYNPTLSRHSQTVGIVDWYDDPHITSDIKAFDHHYGLKAETSKSFRKVNQDGHRTPLPSAKQGRKSADEISLDVEAVRSVCQTCRILLVEAKAPKDKDLAAAEDTAVRLGANEVSNSWGGPERREPASLVKAFNHPGVVITASTGDDGWYDWDFINAKFASPSAAQFPSTDPNVVSVGGTGFQVTNPSAGTGNQYVWNNNGPDDQIGLGDGRPEGAGGGGCSHLFKARSFQSHFAGYTAAGCKGKRLAADVSQLADPATGFDEYNTWVPSGDHKGWITVGGTSLASPMIAAMFALAGGSGQAAYPARTIYENATLHPSTVTDIVDGGNGLCGGDTTTNCGNFFDAHSNPPTHNPNAIGAGLLDCSFPRNNTDPTSPPALSSECNAVAGFDGPSGVGTPIGIGLFTPTSPTVSLKTPKIVKLHHPASFSAKATPRLGSAHITGFSFAWGDGHTTSSTSGRAHHTYTKAGIHVVTVTATDSSGQQSVAQHRIVVGHKLHIVIFRSIIVRAGHKAKFTAEVTDPNTGGKLRKVHWNWGDHHSSNGLKVSHTFHQAGKYKISVIAIDNTGVKTKRIVRLTVKG
jgi:hypothetical protein